MAARFAAGKTRNPARRRPALMRAAANPGPARAEGSVRIRALDAATELLVAQGAENLSIRTIASRAGIGISSLYHHFPNKEALLLHIALIGFQKLTREIICPSDPDPAVGPFSNAARAFLSHVARQPALHDLMFDQHLMARHDDLRAAEREAFTAFIDQVARDPRFPQVIASSIAATFWALGRGLAATALSQPDRTLSPDYRRQLGQALGYLIDRNL